MAFYQAISWHPGVGIGCATCGLWCSAVHAFCRPRCHRPRIYQRPSVRDRSILCGALIVRCRYWRFRGGARVLCGMARRKSRCRSPRCRFPQSDRNGPYLFRAHKSRRGALTADHRHHSDPIYFRRRTLYRLALQHSVCGGANLTCSNQLGVDRLLARLVACGHRASDGDWALAKTAVSGDAGSGGGFKRACRRESAGGRDCPSIQCAAERDESFPGRCRGQLSNGDQKDPCARAPNDRSDDWALWRVYRGALARRKRSTRG